MLLHYLATVFPFLRPPPSSPPVYRVNKMMVDCNFTNDDPTTRLSFSGIGGGLTGYPSTGGIYVLM